MRRNERGLTMIGFLFVAGVIVLFVIVGFRVLPSYVEYYSVEKVLQSTLREEPSASQAELKRALSKRIQAEYIDSVNAGDLVVTRDGNQLVATLSWQKVLPMIANASILLEFEARAVR
jgi:hypothetical protein